MSVHVSWIDENTQVKTLMHTAQKPNKNKKKKTAAQASCECILKCLHWHIDH